MHSDGSFCKSYAKFGSVITVESVVATELDDTAVSTTNVASGAMGTVVSVESAAWATAAPKGAVVRRTAQASEANRGIGTSSHAN